MCPTQVKIAPFYAPDLRHEVRQAWSAVFKEVLFLSTRILLIILSPIHAIMKHSDIHNLSFVKMRVRGEEVGLDIVFH